MSDREDGNFRNVLTFAGVAAVSAALMYLFMRSNTVFVGGDGGGCKCPQNKEELIDPDCPIINPAIRRWPKLKDELEEKERKRIERIKEKIERLRMKREEKEKLKKQRQEEEKKKNAHEELTQYRIEFLQDYLPSYFFNADK